MAGPGEDTAVSHRLHWDESSLQGQQPRLLPLFLALGNPVLWPEPVLVTSPRGRSTVPGLELETLSVSLPLAGCLTLEQTALSGPLCCF